MGNAFLWNNPNVWKKKQLKNCSTFSGATSTHLQFKLNSMQNQPGNFNFQRTAVHNFWKWQNKTNTKSNVPKPLATQTFHYQHDACIGNNNFNYFWNIQLEQCKYNSTLPFGLGLTGFHIKKAINMLFNLQHCGTLELRWKMKSCKHYGNQSSTQISYLSVQNWLFFMVIVSGS